MREEQRERAGCCKLLSRGKLIPHGENFDQWGIFDRRDPGRSIADLKKNVLWLVRYVHPG